MEVEYSLFLPLLRQDPFFIKPVVWVIRVTVEPEFCTTDRAPAVACCTKDWGIKATSSKNTPAKVIPWIRSWLLSSLPRKCKMRFPYYPVLPQAHCRCGCISPDTHDFAALQAEKKARSAKGADRLTAHGKIHAAVGTHGPQNIAKRHTYRLTGSYSAVCNYSVFVAHR